MRFKKIDGKRAKSYLFTFRPMNPQDDQFVQGARRLVRGLNQAEGRSIYRLSMTPSKPRKEFAWKYKNKHSPRKVRIEDATTVDVYVHRKG